MYGVSDAYKEAMKQPVQRFRMTGTVGTIPFTDDNILQGSMSITNQCSDGTEVKIGQVYIAELDVTLMNTNLARYSLKNKKITPVFGLQLADKSYEDVPLGVFNISEANWTASGIVIKAYDNMYLFEKSCDIQSISGMPYSLAKTACDTCGLELGTTDIEFSKFKNGSEQLSMLTENDIETWRDFISWVAQTVGCNVFADRDGKIIFRQYGQDVVDTINPNQRLTGASFSDFETRYTGLSCVNIAEKTTSYYGMPVDDALTYNLGSNPFLQYGTSTTVEQQRRAVLEALQQIDYVPFSLSMIGNPAYDLMDVFSFPEGLGDADKLFCMTKYTFNYHGEYQMEGVGENPALANGKSKTDKNISGLMSSSDDYGMHYTVFTNADTVTVGDGENKSIANVTFIVRKTTHVHIEFEILLTAETTETGEAWNWTENDAVATVTYYLNGEEITTYYPVETWQDGQHILHLMYDLQAVAAQIHTWDIWISMTGGQITMDKYGILGVISGVGLVADSDWDGNISAGDNIHAIHFWPMFRQIADVAELKGHTPMAQITNDKVGRIDFLSMFGNITDSGIAVGTMTVFTPYTNADKITTSCTVDSKTGWQGSGDTKAGTALQVLTTAVHGSIDHVTTTSVNAVFYVSFDSGATWVGWTAKGWAQDASMIKDELEAVTADQWSQGGTDVMFRIDLGDQCSAYSLNIYGAEV